MAERGDRSEYFKAYGEKNRERIAAYKKEWRERNKERVQAYKREYFIANKERYLIWARESRARRPEYARERARRPDVRERMKATQMAYYADPATLDVRLLNQAKSYFVEAVGIKRKDIPEDLLQLKAALLKINRALKAK